VCCCREYSFVGVVLVGVGWFSFFFGVFCVILDVGCSLMGLWVGA